jgi:hypothetical protein
MVGAGCCGAASCACVIADGTHTTVKGSGSGQDPFRIDLDFGFGVVDDDTFNLTLSGLGTEDSPYVLSVAFAGTASVKDFPDWSDTAPTNGQVPVWNTGLGAYIPGSPTPAAAGSVSHDTSLAGDGSPGDELTVVHDPDRFTATTADGIGLTDAGINRQIRRFANAAARDAADPAPELNTFSVLDTRPGRLEVWGGSYWAAIDAPAPYGGSLLVLSGEYEGGPVRTFTKQLSETTDPSDGTFSIFNTPELGDAAGVLSCVVQPVGTVPFACLVQPLSNSIQGKAFRLDTGAPYPAQPIQAVVTALLY